MWLWQRLIVSWSGSWSGSPTRINCPVVEAGVAGAGEGGVGGPAHLVHTVGVGSTVGGGGRGVGGALVDIPAPPAGRVEHSH